jgi:hypothetical protein
MDITIFSIIHIFMYVIICKCLLIWDKLIQKETHHKEIYLWETKKFDSRFSFMARFELMGLLNLFFSGHLLHNIEDLYDSLFNILIIIRRIINLIKLKKILNQVYILNIIFHKIIDVIFLCKCFFFQ